MVKKQSIKKFNSPLKNFIIRETKIKSSKHFEICDCHKLLYSKLYNILYKKELAYQKKEELQDFVKKERIQRLPALIYTEMFEIIGDSKYDYIDYCKYEAEDSVDLVKLFIDKYDMTDPRAATIVKTVVDNKLTVLRMQRESSFYGVLINTGKGLVLNPVEDSKRKYNDSVVHAIEVLDKIFEGSKSIVANVSFHEEMLSVYRDINKKKNK